MDFSPLLFFRVYYVSFPIWGTVEWLSPRMISSHYWPGRIRSITNSVMRPELRLDNIVSITVRWYALFVIFTSGMYHINPCIPVCLWFFQKRQIGHKLFCNSTPCLSDNPLQNFRPYRCCIQKILVGEMWPWPSITSTSYAIHIWN